LPAYSAAIPRRSSSWPVSDIKTPKELEARRSASRRARRSSSNGRAFAKGCGIDAGKVKIVNVDPAGAAPAVINGQVDAIAGFAQGWVPSIEDPWQTSRRGCCGMQTAA